MSSTVYQSANDAAIRMLTAKGQPITAYRVLIQQFDPLNPQFNQGSLVMSGQTIGVVIPASNTIIRSIDETILSDPQRLQKFRYLYVAGQPLGNTFILRPGDVLITAEAPYRILGSAALNPDGSGVILYTVSATVDTSFVLPSSEELARHYVTEDGDDMITQDGDFLLEQPV